MQNSRSGEAGLLSGLRVVEVGEGLAAAIAGMLLAEQGAEVVRVLPGTPANPVLSAILSRGKSELHLDPSSESVQRLLGQADVVLEEASSLDKRGAELATLRRDHPRLITCSIPAFPPHDPRAGAPGHEAIAGTAGFSYSRAIGKPVYHEFPVGSVLAALFAANGVLAALIARLRSGRGQHVESSLYEANLFSQVLQILAMNGLPRAFLPLKMVGSPFMGVWECADGRYLYAHLTVPAHNARALEILEAAGCRSEVAELTKVMSPATVRDPSQVKSVGEARRIRAILARTFKSKSADEWEALFGEELCCLKVRKVEEWVRDSMAAGMPDACTLEDPELGTMRVPGPAISAPAHPARALPRRIVSAEELLARWQEPATEEVRLAASGGAVELRRPLEGLRVLDLSRVIAGPCAARVLAELGADVVSLQSPTSLDWALSFHLMFNAGKRSMTLDFSGDEGKRKLWALMEQLRPDALVQNYRSLEIARSIGIDFEAVHARLPSTVYTYLNAYGTEGGFKDRPGFEQVVQAVTGIQETYGRGGRPKLFPAAILDIGSGLLGAFATQLGLYERLSGGTGLFVSTHMTSMALLLQIAHLAESQSVECLEQAQKRGSDVKRDARREVVAELLRTSDGYAVVAGPWGELSGWLKEAGLSTAIGSPRQVLQAAAPAFRRRTVESLQRSLKEYGAAPQVGIMRMPRLRGAVLDLAPIDRRPVPLVRRRFFPGLQEMVFIRSPLSLSATPLVDVDPSPVRGAHTRELLETIGEHVVEGTGIIPYPPEKPFILWLFGLIRWGIYAKRSGSI